MSTFLIIGGTGKVGSRLSHILRSQGHDARVASRTHGDVTFDWTAPETFTRALHGVQGVFIIGPGSATDWSSSLTQLLAVAQAQGVRHAVLLSARGVEFLRDGAVARAETALRVGPLVWTILRPTHFAQNFTEAMFVPIDGTVTAPVARGAQPFIDVEDIAHVAATVLVDDAWACETIELSGPIAHTFHEAVEILGERSGQPMDFRDEDPLEHTRRLRDAGTPEGYIAWRMAMLDGIRRGDDAYLSDGVLRVLGRPATSFTDWAAREAAVLTVAS
ncbi:NAD(P)H-binding protein [Cryobacterium sp. SO1]|uniref:NAD(P)H-binding protein n=1 Tax=Cryobacterium sp. SO1 TaxID=1897061 RepID=UPI001022E38A|nr:NAD(P)H-binding protein [Cryobacterium sp. SO1]RZI34846.1 NAD(P)H azoreductase [Cryobacterium sp. SO1]